MGMPAVQINNVSKVIKGKCIVKNLNFNVREGEIFGFLGPNGAGKTTTIRMMVGLAKITEGDIFICGHSISKNRSEAVGNIGAIVENPELYKFMTGYQNLKYFARLHPNITKEKIDETIEIVGLKKSIHHKVRTYSLGMKQRLGLAQCILHQPKVLILDEPTNGLDPAGIKEIRFYLKKLAHTSGMTIIVSSHLLSEMELMCDRIAIINNGEIVNIQNLGEEKVTHAVLFDVENAISVKDILSIHFPEVSIEIVGESIKVNIEKERIPDIVNVLSSEKIPVFGIRNEIKSLEEKFLAITGEGDKTYAKVNAK